jgi:hypothetical protein
MKNILILTIAFLFLFQQSFSQASLAAEDFIEDLTAKTGNEKISYSVIKDAKNSDQWYYIPREVRVSEKVLVNGTKEPEFSLVKYQYPDPKNYQKTKEGGIIQFTVVFAPKEGVVEQLRSELIKKTNNPKIRLGALPMKTAKFRLLKPDTTFLATALPSEGIAPTIASQKMAFVIPITDIGADVYDALIKRTGVGMNVIYTYKGLTPASGFKVTVNWDNVYNFFSKNTKIYAEASYLSFGGRAQSERQDISKSLKESKCIHVEMETGEAAKDSLLNLYLDPIMKKIEAEVYNANFKATASRDSILMAQSVNSQRPKEQGFWSGFFKKFGGGVDYSRAIKNVSERRTGSDTITFNVRNEVERQTLMGGFIGIGEYKYTDEMLEKKGIVLKVSAGNWEKALIQLPQAIDPSSGIKGINFDVSLKNKDKFDSESVTWNPQDGWKDLHGNKRTAVLFPLFGKVNASNPIGSLNFDTKLKIITDDVIEVIGKTKAFNGSENVDPLQNIVGMIRIKTSNLTWRKITQQESNLEYVDVEIKQGVRHIQSVLEPSKNNGTWVEPMPFAWVIKKNEPIDIKIIFKLKDGTKIAWSGNKKYDSINEISLSDSDFNPQKQ